MLIARVIAEPQTIETQLSAARPALAEAGYILGESRLLAHGDHVLELDFASGEERGEADPSALKRLLGGFFAPADILVSPFAPGAPRLFVSDMDSTMIGQECIDELADYAGLKPQIAAITERAMQGELDFESALRERVALLKGLDEEAIERCLKERIFLMPGARVLTGTMRAMGCRTVLVTGGFHHFADPVGAWLGFDRVVGNRLAVADGKLTGELAGPIVDSSTKLEVLREEAGRLSEASAVMATGDGANDIPMLQAADYGIAYHAKPAAREAANGSVDKGDLTAILELLAIPRSDWREYPGPK